MDREAKLDSIRDLEKQIQDHERAIIQLKRARNSLLNVSTHLPPEILGDVFLSNVIPDRDFSGLAEGSYNFVLVCHHWYNVALRPPELWSSWGNTIRDWSRRYARCGSVPLDLVLSVSGYSSYVLDDTLCNALQDHAVRDLIQRVHIRGTGARDIDSAISSVVTEGEETRSNTMESFMLLNSGALVVDFFSRYRLPKLKRFRLKGCNISSWDLMSTRITSLTTLSLLTSSILPTPTLPHLLLILSANPNLQQLMLTSYSSAPSSAMAYPPPGYSYAT